MNNGLTIKYRLLNLLLPCCMALSMSLEAHSDDSLIVDPSSQLKTPFNVSSFVNIHKHPIALERLKELDPGLVRFFINDLRDERQLENVRLAIHELGEHSRTYLLQINLLEQPDTDVFLTDLTAVVDEFSEFIDYWQLGNELDNNNKRFFPFLPSDSNLYSQLLSEFSTVVKENNPDSLVSISISTKVYEIKQRQRFLKRLLASFKTLGPNVVDAVDIHWHKEYDNVESLVSHIEKIKSDFEFLDAQYIMTENNTFTGNAVIRDSKGHVVKEYGVQTQSMQSAYAVKSLYLAFSNGLSYVTFGYPVDRTLFGANKHSYDHPFGLNGMWYSDEKTYGQTKQTKSGPKQSAHTYWFLSRLIALSKKISTGVNSEASETIRFNVETEFGTYVVIWEEGVTRTNHNRPRNYDITNITNAADMIVMTGLSKNTKKWPPESFENYYTKPFTTASDSSMTVQAIRGEPIFILPRQLADKVFGL